MGSLDAPLLVEKRASTKGAAAALYEAAVFAGESVPIILVDVVALLIPSITSMAVGSTAGATALAAATLGTLSVNIAGNMLMTAPLDAMDSIAPGAFGANAFSEVGLSAQRAMLLSLAFLLPAMPLCVYAEPLLVGLGQPAEVARLATRFMRLMSLGLPPYAAFQVLRKFLYAQGGNNPKWTRTPPLIAALIGLASHGVWLTLGVRTLGFDGGPLATSLSYLTMAASLAVLTARSADVHANTWPRGTTQARLWTDGAAWRRLLGYAFPALGTLSEWLFWEVVCFRVGTFGTVSLAAYSTAYAVEPIVFMIPRGISIGLANQVGNLLGAARVSEARRVAAIGVTVSFCATALYSLAMFAARGGVPRLFTSDERVLGVSGAMWAWFCCFLASNGPFSVISGLNRGLGLQRENALCVLLILWPVGAPLVVLGASNVVQVWQHLCVVYALLTSSMAACALCARWTRISEMMRQVAG
jgi:MATE family multidrug resistance protein